MKINLHDQLLELRHRQLELLPRTGPGATALALERAGARVLGWLLRSPARSARLGALLRWLGRRLPALASLGPFARWTATRELPALPRQSFHQAYAERQARAAAAPSSRSRE